MKELLTILTTIGLMLAVTLFLRSLEKPRTVAVSTQPDPDQADIRIKNIRMLKTDEFGYHKFHLRADEARHFLRKATELEKLRLLVSSTEASDWLITAESGWMDDSRKQILLQGEVLVHQEQNDNRDVTGITRDMIVDYASSLAYSTSAATLLSDDNMTSGTGMFIKFSTPGRIRLLSRVTGSHVFD